MNLDFSHVEPVNLTEEDLLWLAKGCEDYYTGLTVKDLVTDALEGWIKLFRLSGDWQGMVGTKVLDHPNGKRELLVYCIAGSKVFKNWREFHQEILKEARRVNAALIGGQAIRPGHIEFYERRIGMQRVGQYFIEEVSDDTLDMGQ